MRRENLARSAAFILLTGGILFLFEYLVDKGVRSSHYSHFQKVNLLASGNYSPGIAVFGPSVSEVGIDPMILQDSTGLESYNFSIDGTGFEQLSGLYRSFADNADKTQCVVLTEFLATFEKWSQLNEVERFAAHLDNRDIYTSLYNIQPELVWKLRYVPFYKFIVIRHPYYKASVIGWKNILKGGAVKDATFGFYPKDFTWDPHLDSLNRITKPFNIQIHKEIVDLYRETLQRLRSKNRKVVMVIPPIYKDGRDLLTNLEEFRSTLKSMEGDGVYLLDLSDMDITTSKEYFYNNSHVNRSGSILLSQRVASFVKEVLADRETGR